MSIRVFEDLPNECLFDIFDYLDIRDIYNGLSDLNSRLNGLIDHMRNLSLTLERNEPMLLSLFASRITRLTLNTWQEIDLCQFTSLQCLTLHQTTINQIHQIQSNHLPHLIYLCMSSNIDLLLIMHFIANLFSNNIPSLRHLHLGHIHCSNPSSWLNTSSLQSISIQLDDPSLIGYILHSCSDLFYLHVQISKDTVAMFRSLPKISNHPLKHFILHDPYHRLLFNHIHLLIKWMNNLRKIYLNFRCDISFIRFIEHLLHRCPSIIRFDCSIDEIINHRTPPPTVEILRSLHRCLERIQCSNEEMFFRTWTTETSIASD